MTWFLKEEQNPWELFEAEGTEGTVSLAQK